MSARPARLELAVFALKNEPMWAGSAHATVPEQESCLGFYEFERVGAVAWNSHCVFGGDVGCVEVFTWGVPWGTCLWMQAPSRVTVPMMSCFVCSDAGALFPGDACWPVLVV